MFRFSASAAGAGFGAVGRGLRSHPFRCLMLVAAVALPWALGYAGRAGEPGGAEARAAWSAQLLAEEGDLPALKQRIERDPEVVDRADRAGYTPLHRAAMGDRVEVVRYLIGQGADVAARTDGGETPLHLAAITGALDAATALIEHGADPKARTSPPSAPEPKWEGWTVLDHAALSGHSEFVRLLLKQGVPAHYPDRPEKSSALHYACWGQVWYKYRNDPKWNGNAETIDLLVERIGDVNLRNYQNQTPLFVAASHGAVKTVRHLLERYPEVEIDGEAVYGETPLHAAVGKSGIPGPGAKDRAGVVRLLLEHGANPDLKNSEGQTPRDCAVAFGERTILKAFETPRPAKRGPVDAQEPAAAAK